MRRFLSRFGWIAYVAIGAVALFMTSCSLLEKNPVVANDDGSSSDSLTPPVLAVRGAAISIAWPFGGAESPNNWSGDEGPGTPGAYRQTGCGWRYTHSGADYSARDLSRSGCSGVWVYAGFSGTVVEAGDRGNGYGNTVVIYDGNRHVALRYSHLSVVGVTRGQWVQWGQYIGRVGNTGNSSGPHLHLAAYENIDHFYSDGYPVIPTLCDSEHYTCATYFYCW